MSRIHPGLFCVIATFAFGCARGPNVSTEQLPLRKVVVYRNGVGYFERSGSVDSERVTFNMRGSMVGDFLATLAVVERGGNSVRAASFPLKLEELEEPAPEPKPRGRHEPALSPVEGPPPPPKPKDPLREVALELDGKDHELLVGYVSRTPVWRPSYRVVIQKDGKALLQAWGVVQNLSGEDWQDVELSLVAGAPLAFESTLGTPVIPQRPVVTDQGEVILEVPQGSTSLAEMAAPMAAPAPPPTAEAPAMAYDEEQSAMSSGAGVASGGPGGFNFTDKKAAMAKPMPSSAATRQSLTLGGLGSDLQRVNALANVAVQGSNTVYALPSRVTVPNDSATMVLLLNQTIPGESVFLFSPDPGVPDSAAHPFRVARFANTTKGLLEKGPIAVFDSGSFLGEGMLDPLPPEAKATVPFALDRSLAVQTDTRQDERGARLYRVEAGHLYVERDSVLETTYLVKNGGAQAARVLLKHPRSGDTTLEKPPAGTEDNVGSGFAIIPTEAPARGQNKLIVTETRPWTSEVDWLNPLADLAIKAYLQDPKRDGALSAKLSEAWAIRMKVRQLQDENDKLAAQQNELNNALEEIRRNLRAIEKNTQAGDLRAKLTARLGATSSQYDGISKRLVELGLAISENQVRLRDALLDLNIPVQHR